MSYFTKKPTMIGNETSDGDWVICYRGHEVGRVHPVGNLESVFGWAINKCVPPANGSESTEQGALEAIKVEVLHRTELVFPQTFHQRRHVVAVWRDQ
ncbi:MAG: hypothetical protein ACFB11_00915 [Paracoccaceae bacterium]